MDVEVDDGAVVAGVAVMVDDGAVGAGVAVVVDDGAGVDEQATSPDNLSSWASTRKSEQD